MKRSTATKRRIAAIVLCALMMINIFSAAVEDNPATIYLNYDGMDYSYTTHAGTVEEFLTVEGIQVKPNDYISHGRNVAITDGMQISVSVAKYITVYDEGATYSAITYQTTVESVLEEFGIPLKGNDGSYPAKGERVYDGIEIVVSRSKLVTFTRNGAKLQYYSYSKTVGEFLDEMGFVCEDDEEVSVDESTKLTDGMTVAIKKKVDAMSPLDFNADLSTARVIVCEASAYTAAADECWPYADGLTATGVKCQVGVVAVDPRVIPLKSKLYIETVDGSFVYGYCTAEDTGGAIKGNKIDLAMNTKSDCFQFGRRKVKVYILD